MSPQEVAKKIVEQIPQVDFFDKVLHVIHVYDYMYSVSCMLQLLAIFIQNYETLWFSESSHFCG